MGTVIGDNASVVQSSCHAHIIIIITVVDIIIINNILWERASRRVHGVRTVCT
jgi:hypothetical protein